MENKRWKQLVVLLMSLIFYPPTASVEYKGCLSEKYFRFTTEHTACLSKSSDAASSGISNAVKKSIVEKHNALRRQQKATNMQKMVWDDELAAIAQRWTDNCEWKHDKYRNVPGGMTVGQNLAAGQRDWNEAVNSWYNEIRLFKYGSQRAIKFLEVGHYTQMTWANTSRIGCGFTYCEKMKYKRYYACNYGPAGNIGDWSKPFKRGRACADCPNSCNNRLCDCNGKTCKNGGVLDVNTCKCKCTQPWHLPGDCSLNCKAVVESKSCRRDGFYNSRCVNSSSVYTKCPVTCNICPYGGVGYKSKIRRRGVGHAGKTQCRRVGFITGKDRHRTGAKMNRIKGHRHFRKK